MNKFSNNLKPLVPLFATAYAVALIYVTALPTGGNDTGIGSELLVWLLTLAGIGLTLFLVNRVEPGLFPDARQFALKRPKALVVAGVLLMAPLWLLLEGYIVFGFTSLFHNVQLEPFTSTASELREDLLASVHAVLLAPVLEELCFRQMAISPFRRRGAQIVVCVVMALLFGILHVRNFPGAFLSAMVYGLIFIWTRNIWYSTALHAGHNLSATLLAIYYLLGLGELQMSRLPVIILPDVKVLVGSVVLAAVGLLLIKAKR